MRRALGTSLALLFGAVGAVVGQFAPPGTGGVAALAGGLKQLGTNKRVLMIGAHPDDEYSDLVALFARGMGAQVAYLSLSRGEGGQNLIGPELGPELGVIRSEELLAARRIDGARQFFTRAYDFGYSKTLDESLRLWPRDSVLKDVLDVVRRFRPQIIVSVFSGTSRDGHGQCSTPWRVDPTTRSPWRAGASTARRTKASSRNRGRGSVGWRSSSGGIEGAGRKMATVCSPVWTPCFRGRPATPG